MKPIDLFRFDHLFDGVQTRERILRRLKATTETMKSRPAFYRRLLFETGAPWLRASTVAAALAWLAYVLFNSKLL